MSTFEIPIVSEIAGLAVVFTGRQAPPRPAPATLVPLLDLDGDAPVPLVIVRQIHSSRCLTVRGPDLPAGGPPHVAGEADALVTAQRGIALGVATADCVPLVVIDPEARALAVVHAGWRGTLAGVLSATIRTMRDQLGARPEMMRVGAGPAAGACCYEVGPEVFEPFTRERPALAERVVSQVRDGKALLDLVEANRLEAIEEGVDPDHFGSAGICTICRPDLCHSYRRDGAAAGRMWLLAALRP
jgi:hypothetical protein